MKLLALIQNGAVVDVRPDNEANWPEGSDVRDLPWYATVGWMPAEPNWLQPDGSEPTAAQLRYVVPALVFSRRLTPTQARLLWSMAGTTDGVAWFLLQLAALRNGVESDHPDTVAAQGLAQALWGPEDAAALFARPTQAELDAIR